jgi:DNA-binding beta-propeller fold protein YncE
MSHRAAIRWLLLALFAFALAVRLHRVRWDDMHFFHPDERAIGFAVERLSFKPLRLNPEFFAYGSFPMYVIRVAASLATRARPVFRGFDEAILVGRVVSACWGAGTVLLLALAGMRLYGRAAGLLAGLFLAASVSHLQNSHFAISDVPLAALVLLTLLLLDRAVERKDLSSFALSGACLGLSLATKFSALPLFAPAAVALLFLKLSGAPWRRVILAGAALGAAAATAFFVGQPYAVLDYKNWSASILEQSRMVRNAGLFPYTNQYVGTPKYLYNLEQLVLWGMGPALGVACLVGAAWAAVRAVKRREKAQALLFAWVVPYFVITGSFDIKFPRYLLPIYPMLVLWAAAWLVERSRTSRSWFLVTLGVAVLTLAWTAAFISIYSRPHSFVTASEWFYERAPAGAKVLTQDWDEGFPFPLTGGRTPERFCGALLRPGDPCNGPSQLSFYEPDNEAKLVKMAAALSSADWLALQTPRIYGAIARVPRKYPLTWNLFRQLFAGKLGYKLAADFTSRPGLFGLTIPDELADESFTVYDHPKVLVFQNVERLSQAEITNRVRSSEVPDLSRRQLLLASTGQTPTAPVRSSFAKASEDKQMREKEAPPGSLEQPRGLAVGPSGNVYVADFGHDRIQILDPALAPLSAWGSKGDGPGNFNQPSAVAVGGDGRVFVADTWNGRVQVFSAAGEPVAQWSADFFGPRGVTPDGAGGVYVTDTGNGRVVRLSGSGDLVAKWGGKGSGPGQFQEPVGIAVDRKRRIWVCDNGNARIQIFDGKGSFEREIPVDGWRREVFSEPQAAADPSGGVWVTVPLSGEIRHFAADGTAVQTIRGGAGMTASFGRPMGIAVLASGELVVSDLSGRLVRLPKPGGR